MEDLVVVVLMQVALIAVKKMVMEKLVLLVRVKLKMGLKVK